MVLSRTTERPRIILKKMFRRDTIGGTYYPCQTDIPVPRLSKAPEDTIHG